MGKKYENLKSSLRSALKPFQPLLLRTCRAPAFGIMRSVRADTTAGVLALAVVLLNRAEAPARLSVSWAELGLAAGTKVRVRDVMDQKDLPAATDTWGATVGKHDVAFIRLSPFS